jgi:RimJ/RimL family protein N-acetyltransferase
MEVILKSMEVSIETERLLLRPFTLEDTDDLFEMDSNPKVHQFLGNRPMTSKSEARETIANILKQYETCGIGRLAICLKATEEFVGWSGLKYECNVRKEFNYYDLGYRLKEQFWGQGIATESAIATLNFGFKSLQLKTICAAADVNHTASNIILRKIGMNKSGVFTFEGASCNWYTKDNPYN